MTLSNGNSVVAKPPDLLALVSKTIQVLAAMGLAVSIILASLGMFWIAPLGNISPVSIGAMSGLYLVMHWRLRKDGLGPGESIILSVLYANAFAQTFEILYHFTFPIYFSFFVPPFLNGSDVRFLALEIVMLLPVALIKKHLRFGPVSALLLLFFAVNWGVWILYGFPQYYTTATFYPRILYASDTYHLSLILNFGAKTLLALLFASLAWGNQPRRLGLPVRPAG